MGSAFRAGMTLIVISLLFLAFNLVWAPKLPTVRWDFSEEKIHTLSPAAQQLPEDTLLRLGRTAPETVDSPLALRKPGLE